MRGLNGSFRQEQAKMAKTIAIIGAFDTKGAEYAFLREQIVSRGFSVLTLNTGVMGTTDLFKVDVEAEEVAKAGGMDLKALREKKDRGEAMKVMTAGAAKVAKSLYDKGKKFDGIIGMGGTGGTTVVTSAMRALPVGVPKVCISTAASGETSGLRRDKRYYDDTFDCRCGGDKSDIENYFHKGGGGHLRDGIGGATESEG